MLHKVTAWLLVVFWMGLIFYFSHQPAGVSSDLSGGISEVIVSILNSMPFVQMETESIHTLIRKLAHYFVYLFLGISTIHALQQSGMAGVKSIWFAMGICVLYAISDEIHQLYIPGRSGEVSDVIIDAAGSGTGIAIYFLCRRFVPSVFKKKSRTV